jgi:hypothetical protein
MSEFLGYCYDDLMRCLGKPEIRKEVWLVALQIDRLPDGLLRKGLEKTFKTYVHHTRFLHPDVLHGKTDLDRALAKLPPNAMEPRDSDNPSDSDFNGLTLDKKRKRWRATRIERATEALRAGVDPAAVAGNMVCSKEEFEVATEQSEKPIADPAPEPEPEPIFEQTDLTMIGGPDETETEEPWQNRI